MQGMQGMQAVEKKREIRNAQRKPSLYTQPHCFSPFGLLLTGVGGLVKLKTHSHRVCAVARL
jgi:hypothetical protein